MLIFTEVWICPPTCDREHDEYELTEMLGISRFMIHQVHAKGLRPFRLSRDMFYTIPVYRCSDIREFCLELNVPVGIDYRIYDRVRRRTGDYLSGTPHRRAFWRERQELREIPPTVVKKPRRQVDKSLSGFVYLIRWNDVYKIGMSKDVDRRLSDLVQLPGILMEVIHKVKAIDMRAAEKYLHRRYAKYRLPHQREWFALPQNSVDWIRALKDGDLDDIGETVDAERAG